MLVLTVNNLSKHYDSFKAVKNISFSLEEGEILGLLGLNGAGKTTTIQMLLGVLSPTNGEINYFGKPLSENREEILEKVNFSSTYTHLPWRLTVLENLYFISYLYDIQDRTKRINTIIELFKLEKLAKKSMHELSAGQKTRVNLAKAFINYPKVLLLDEPTASLDPEVAIYIHDFLKHQRTKFKSSIIFTSHNMAEVEELCDRVIFLHQGKIIANDTPVNLAKTIEICHITLLATEQKKTVDYFINQKLKYVVSGKHITVDLKEKQIPGFLKNLNDHQIGYSEISIEKPSLEDYFLSMAGEL